ncbi:Flowering time control protein FPA, partial [Linum grandiflorum]
TCYIIIIKTFRCSELSDFQLSSVTLSNSSSDQSDRSKTLATATMNSRGGGGGRDRLRRDPPPSRADDGGGGGGRRPSRHLWVGNLSPNLQEQDLTRHFVEFGELDSVAFQPGRHFAFVNFKNDEDGIAALKVLQGFPVDGNPLKIEFVKVVSFASFLPVTFMIFSISSSFSVASSANLYCRSFSELNDDGFLGIRKTNSLKFKLKRLMLSSLNH